MNKKENTSSSTQIVEKAQPGWSRKMMIGLHQCRQSTKLTMQPLRPPHSDNASRGSDTSRCPRHYFRLLLTLLGGCEFLNDLTAFPGFDLFPRIFHESRESACQFVNALRLPSLNRFGWNQFCADADSGRT
jgi:hypothetical protein